MHCIRLQNLCVFVQPFCCCGLNTRAFSGCSAPISCSHARQGFHGHSWQFWAKSPVSCFTVVPKICPNSTCRCLVSGVVLLTAPLRGTRGAAGWTRHTVSCPCSRCWQSLCRKTAPSSRSAASVLSRGPRAAPRRGGGTGNATSKSFPRFALSCSNSSSAGYFCLFGLFGFFKN